MDDDWDFDHDNVSDDSVLYRRIPENPDFTVETVSGDLALNPAALQRTEGEGMSVHFERVLATHRRDGDRYAEPPKGIIQFASRVPRSAGGGVVVVPDPDEQDVALAEAHGEVRGPLRGARGEARQRWKDIRAVIAEEFEWVRRPEVKR